MTTAASAPSVPPARSVRSIVTNTAMLWLATGLAAAALWPIYRAPQLVTMVVGALAVGSLIAIVGALGRWSAPIVALATVVAFAATGVPLAVPSQAIGGVIPSLDGLIALFAGVALGWKQLLTISLPVGAYESLFVPFFALTLVLTVVCLSAALRARRGGLAPLGSVVLFLAAVTFGPAEAFWPVPLALGLFAAVLAWLGLRRWHARRAVVLGANTGSARALRRDGRRLAIRSAVSATVLLSVAAGAASVVTFALPPRGERDVLRSAVVQPFDPRDYVSPLSGFRNYWQAPVDDELLLSLDGLPEGSRLSVATLDSYNGVVYSVGSGAADPTSGVFTRVPFEMDRSAVAGRKVSVDVRVGAYTGPWLPTAGSLERVIFRGPDAAGLRESLYFNGTTGTTAVIDTLDSGDGYTFDAVVTAPPMPAELLAMTPGSATVPLLGVLPDELSLALDRYIVGADGPGGQLAAALDGLRTEGYISHGQGAAAPSRSGHAADRITELLTDDRMIGDAEQYSVTASLMAGELGFPARVVFGFLPAVTAAGTAEVRGRDVAAWIEVDTAQHGWVALDPTPAVREIPDEQPKEPTSVSRPQTIVPPTAIDPAPAERKTNSEANRDEPVVVDPFIEALVAVLRWTGVGALLLLAVAAPFLAIIFVKKNRRRQRRRSGTNLDRITGGWREFEDRVIDHGYVPSTSATRSEVAALVGGSRSSTLAAVADRAVFAPADPNGVEADRVWRNVLALSAALDLDSSRWGRLKALISLRSLRGYTGRTAFKS